MGEKAVAVVSLLEMGYTHGEGFIDTRVKSLKGILLSSANDLATILWEGSAFEM